MWNQVLQPTRVLLVIALIAGGILFLLAFYYRYWIWRGCFNGLGRCYDSGTEPVYLEQAGLA